MRYQLNTGNEYRDIYTLRAGPQLVQTWGMRVFRYLEILGAPEPVTSENLADSGQAALDLLTSTGTASWMNMIGLGAGATAEAWDPSLKANLTFSHPWAASPAFIVPSGLFGIQPLEAGYATFQRGSGATRGTSYLAEYVALSKPRPARIDLKSLSSELLHFKEVAAGLSDHLAPQGLEFATWWSAGQSRRRQRVGHDPAKGSSSNS